MAAKNLLAVDRVAPVKARLLMTDCLGWVGWVGPMVRSVYPVAVSSGRFQNSTIARLLKHGVEYTVTLSVRNAADLRMLSGGGVCSPPLVLCSSQVCPARAVLASNSEKSSYVVMLL